MKKVSYLVGALVLVNIALFGINSFNGWRAKKSFTPQSESAASATVRAEQKTYRVSFKVSPVVQSSAKNQ